MRPARLIRRLVLFLVVIVARLVRDRRQRSKYVERDHGDDLRVDGLAQARLGHADVVDDLVETRSLDLFALQVGDRVHEVEYDAALLQLFDEQLLLLLHGRVFDGRQRLELFVGGGDEAGRALLALDLLGFDDLTLRERVDGSVVVGGAEAWRG